MSRRRWLLPLLFFSLIVAVDVANWWPLSDHSVAAQPPFSFGLQSMGVVQYSTASVTAVNTTSPVALWSSLISGAYTATSANSNWAPSGVATPAPLHLQLNGTLSTNAGCSVCAGPVNVGVSYGMGVTGVASVALANAAVLPAGMASAPMQVDVWISPVATATNTALPGGGTCYYFLKARLQVATASGGNAPTTFDANTCAGSATAAAAFLASAEQVNVLWQWASATTSNSATVYQGVLNLGL